MADRKTGFTVTNSGVTSSGPFQTGNWETLDTPARPVDQAGTRVGNGPTMAEATELQRLRLSEEEIKVLEETEERENHIYLLFDEDVRDLPIADKVAYLRYLKALAGINRGRKEGETFTLLFQPAAQRLDANPPMSVKEILDKRNAEFQYALQRELERKEKRRQAKGVTAPSAVNGQDKEIDELDFLDQDTIPLSDK